MFCPHCGNSTLDKVEAVIGPDGTEQYGVRKRFNTRGTRYSLPKPKVRILIQYNNSMLWTYSHNCFTDQLDPTELLL